MDEKSEQLPAEYMPPAPVTVGEFIEDTLGSWNGTAPDWFISYYW
ncbi:hypothetical protein [Streptomyces humicola]|nr:hypothetical protein [Streptomyces humicola]